MMDNTSNSDIKNGKVYFISDMKNIKIGYTANSIEKRIKQLSTGSPDKLYCLGYIHGDKQKEHELHVLFEQNKIRNNGEWFIPSQELIDYINKNNQMENVWIDYDNGEINKYLAIKSDK